VSYTAINLRVSSQQVFIVVSVYFLIVLVRKLLDTLSYYQGEMKGHVARMGEMRNAYKMF
jgi:hypothetical protein